MIDAIFEAFRKAVRDSPNGHPSEDAIERALESALAGAGQVYSAGRKWNHVDLRFDENNRTHLVELKRHLEGGVDRDINKLLAFQGAPDLAGRDVTMYSAFKIDRYIEEGLKACRAKCNRHSLVMHHKTIESSSEKTIVILCREL